MYKSKENLYMYIGNIDDLCKYMRKFEVVSVEPYRGVYGENIIKLTYRHKEDQD